MKIKTIKLSRENIETAKAHPLLIKLKMTLNNDLQEAFNFHASEAQHFNHYERPIMTKDGLVIGNLASLYSACTNQVEELLVDIVEELDEDELIRFINAKSIFFRRNYSARFSLLVEMRDYLENNPKGIRWAGTLEGDILEKLSNITGYSKSSIKMLQVIGKQGLNNFDKINEGEISLRHAYDTIKANIIDEDNVLSVKNNEEKSSPTTVIEQPLKKKKYKAENYIPFFVDDKPSIKVFGRVIPLNEEKIVEKNDAIIYFFKTENGAVVEISIKNLKLLKAIS